MIKLEDVKKTYKAKKTADTEALKNISLTINSKGLVFIVGTSGSGKSTLLNCVGGLDGIDSGSITINGMDITKLKEKELDKFRNSYIGFIFQDYNIIEDYDVYQNVNLALELQGIEDSNLVTETLNKLGLRNLEKRNINELSGGQKQRVAIARALVKSPSLILADEPTGNLDSNSSKQIFEILKEISKERTVIVVSHDKDMAKKYADRIIEINDGEITKDTKPKREKEENEEITLIQHNITRKNIFKLTKGNIKAKKGKFILTTILMSFAIFFFAFSFNIYIFSPSSLAYDTMEQNQEYYLKFYREECKYDNGELYCNPIISSDTDIENMAKKANLTLNKTYILMDGNKYLDLEFLYEKDQKSRYPSYYDTYSPTYVVLEDESVLANLKGNHPENSNEIVVNKRIAEKIVKYGVIDANNLVYKPTNLETLLKDKKELSLGANSVVIVGYLEDDDLVLEPVKELKEIKDFDLSQYFNNYVSDKYNIYVTKTFINDVKLKVDYDYMASSTYTYLTYFGTKKLIYGTSKIFTEPVEVLTSDGNIVIDQLQEDEIIIPISGIKNLYEEFQDEYNKYAEQHPNLTYDEAVTEYTKTFIDEKKIFSKSITLYQEGFNQEYSGKIVGISFDDNLYYNLELVKKYSSYNKRLIGAQIYQTDKKTIKKIFNTFAISGDQSEKDSGIYDVVNFKFVDHVNGTKEIYNAFYVFIVIITVVFIVFGILLFYNFITTTISYSKKKIGILRAIGTSSKDVRTIFRYESFIIGIVSGFISIFVWIFANNLINKFLHHSLYNAKYIILEPVTFVVVFLFIIIFAFLLTSASISRIVKIKPIDAILNK